MAEKALAVPLTGDEIIEIVVEEARRRLRMQSPLQGGAEYAGFDVSFEHHIRLSRMPGTGGERSTMVWGRTTQGEQVASEPAAAAHDKGDYKSDPDVNEERMKHDLPLTVEANDGRGGKLRKKVKVKGA
jgi:hypothetical protein